MQILWIMLLLVVAQGSSGDVSAKDTADHVDDLVGSIDKVLGSKTVKDKLAELTKSSGTERQQMIILRKSDIADDIPEGKLHNTTSIVRKIGDATVIVNTTIDSTKDGDGVIITFESEVKPPPNTKVCKTDTNCSDHHFCYRESLLGFDLSYCVACSKNGGECHADSHCCEKSLCRWGRCREGATSGQVGSICGRTEDCGEKGCCALVEGFEVPVCRPLASEGQHCSKDEAATKAKDKSPSLSVFEKLLRRRNKHPGLTFECPCVKGLHCVNYGQTFSSIFDFPDDPLASSLGRVCVPGWALPDHPVSQTLDEITKLQSQQISDVIGDVGGKD